MYYIFFFILTFFSLYGAVNFFSIIYKTLYVKKDKTGVKIYEKSEKNRKWTQP